MHILFINSGGKYDIFFSAQFNKNSNKKKLSNPWVQPNPCGLSWIYVIDWVWLNFFWPTTVGWVKKPQPNPCTPLALTRENQNANNKSVEQVWKHNRSETSTHSHREEENERGCEKEREGSLVPIFPPLKFRIVRTFPGSVGFCSQVSILWGKRGSTGLKFQPTVIEKRKLREAVRKREKVLLYLYFHP